MARRSPSTPRSSAEDGQREVIRQLLEEITRLRLAKNISEERLAGDAGLSLDLFRYAREHHHDLWLTDVLRICAALGVTPGALLNRLSAPNTSRSSGRAASRFRQAVNRAEARRLRAAAARPNRLPAEVHTKPDSESSTASPTARS
jgi:transcriptional regulator with XRE-family HTH domain